MSTLDLLHHLIDQLYAEGFGDGRRSAALGGAHHQDDSDGIDGVSWMRIARHAEANPARLSAWEKELVDSALCSMHYGVELTPRQRSKLEWIFRSRFGGKLN